MTATIPQRATVLARSTRFTRPDLIEALTVLDRFPPDAADRLLRDTAPFSRMTATEFAEFIVDVDQTMATVDDQPSGVGHTD